MNAKENIELVAKLEREFDVQNWKINGVEVWPYIRAELGLKCYHIILNQGKKTSVEPVEQSGKLQRVFRIVKRYFKGKKQDQRIKNQKGGYQNLISSSLNYYRVIEGLGFDKFADSLALKLKDENQESSFVIEHNSNYVTLPEISSLYDGENKEFIEDFVYYHVTRSRIKSKYKKAAVQLDGFQEFLNHPFIKEIQLAQSVNQASLINFSTQVKSMAKTFASFMKNNGIKTFYCFNYYSLHNYALIHAAHLCKIPSFDIQHGVAGDVHMSYGKGRLVPQRGFNIFPSNFWTWDQASADTIDSWNSEAIKSHVKGNPWVDLWKSGRANEIFNIQTSEAFKSDLEGGNVVLVSLQNLEDSIPDEVIDLARETEKYTLLLRLHPAKKNYEKLDAKLKKEKVLSKYYLQEATEVPLHYLLPYTSVHITRFSSVAIEAMEYGISTIFLEQNGLDFFASNLPANLVENGIGKSLESLLEKLEIKN